MEHFGDQALKLEGISEGDGRDLTGVEVLLICQTPRANGKDHLPERPDI